MKISLLNVAEDSLKYFREAFSLSSQNVIELYIKWVSTKKCFFFIYFLFIYLFFLNFEMAVQFTM